MYMYSFQHVQCISILHEYMYNIIIIMYTHLEEVLDSLWIIAVALSADSLHLLHLASLTSSLSDK